MLYAQRVECLDILSGGAGDTAQSFPSVHEVLSSFPSTTGTVVLGFQRWRQGDQKFMVVLSSVTNFGLDTLTQDKQMNRYIKFLNSYSVAGLWQRVGMDIYAALGHTY